MTEKELDIVLTAVDVETTGLDPDIHAIIELAAIKFWPDGEILDTFQMLVRPPHGIPERITDYTSITWEMVANEPTVGEALQRFIAWCGGDRILVAYNAPFDAEFITREARRAGIVLPKWQIIDALPWARLRIPNLPNYKLGLVLTAIEYHPDGRLHRALADCHGVVALVHHIVNGYSRKTAAIKGRIKAFDEVATNPATERQIAYLRSLGGTQEQLVGISKRRASHMIDDLKQRTATRVSARERKTAIRAGWRVPASFGAVFFLGAIAFSWTRFHALGSLFILAGFGSFILAGVRLVVRGGGQ